MCSTLWQQLCAAILSSADDIRTLATSREPWATEKARYRLPPLALPDPDKPGASLPGRGGHPFSLSALASSTRI